MKQWSLLLSLRYLSRKRIVLLSIAAVALCTALLVAVSSLFNGFIGAVLDSAGSQMGDVVMRCPPGRVISEYDELIARLKTCGQVESATPVLSGQGLLLAGAGRVRAVQVWGIALPGRFEVVPMKRSLLCQSGLEDDKVGFGAAGQKGGFAGIGVIASPDERTDNYDMEKVRSMVGTTVALTTGRLVENTSANEESRAAKFQRRVLRFTISDVVQTGVYEFDRNFVYVPIESLSDVLYPGAGPVADVIQIRLAAGAEPDRAMAMIRGVWQDFAVGRWDWAYGLSVDSSRQMQAIMTAEYRKQMDVLMLIFGVVSFGVVLLVFCIFYLIVLTKRKDIAIVKSCGAGSFSVSGMFVLFGMFNGAAGAALGVLLGWCIVSHINQIERWILRFLGLKLWKASTYMFDRIPDVVDWSWTGWICIAAVGAAAVGALIPAIAAARVEPVKILRYE